MIRGFEEEEMPDGDDSSHVEKVLKLIEEMREFDAKYHALEGKRIAGAIRRREWTRRSGGSGHGILSGTSCRHA